MLVDEDDAVEPPGAGDSPAVAFLNHECFFAGLGDAPAAVAPVVSSAPGDASAVADFFECLCLPGDADASAEGEPEVVASAAVALFL